MPDLSSRYNPADVEERLYAEWESRGYFHAEPDPSRAPFTIVIPPPNVTGILHMGHALNNTIQDIVIRYRRMKGDNALWVPGTDHAGIATQNVVEKQLAKEGLKRQDLGREQFLQRVWQWKEQYGNTIIRQLKRLGSSCDWQRTRFTMDEGLSEAVAEVFVRLYEKGLIYRGTYIINWCPRCLTALADEEAPRKETKGTLYYIKYPLVQGSRFKVEGNPSNLEPRTSNPSESFIVVATTRPETMLGDTAIAVHPDDPRYKALIGGKAILPLVGREIPIIADEAIEREFGTGAVKVTPAHDPVDFQLGKKHGLEFLNIMTDDAKMANVPAAYQGLDRFKCRERVLADLEAQSLLEKIDEHLHNVGRCYRCDTVIEPRLSPQWFVKMKPLAEPAIAAVKDGTIRFIPPRWEKVYLNWMENIQDWCISRQIWWGHRIPVWYCDACLSKRGNIADPGNIAGPYKAASAQVKEPGIIVQKTARNFCPDCQSVMGIRQDEDVLDTWFSSWLWPFSTLGWPRQTPDLDYFYPTSALVTAPEIIFFWVARMIMAGYFCMGKPPFTTVYIHGTVRDLTGKKMSKSLGNIIDPLDIIKEFGTDALRYTLVTSTAVGTDVFISTDKFTVGRNFANKLWNAARFILQNSPEAGALPDERALSVFDQAILDELNACIRQTTAALDRYHFDAAAEGVYSFLWNRFCDWYIEFVKPTVQGNRASQQVLRYVFERALRLLHPVMPFVSEELWQHFGGQRAEGRGQTTRNIPLTSHLSPDTSIMVAPWPTDDGRRYPEAVQSVDRLTQVISAIRSIRAEFKIPAETGLDVAMAWENGTPRADRDIWEPQIKRLATVGRMQVEPTLSTSRGWVPFVFEGGKGSVHVGQAIDAEKERARINKEIDELRRYTAQLDSRLRDEAFASKAPAEVLAREQEKRRQTAQRMEILESYLRSL
ncbi:MAG: valine--tRNA ligase [Candidatus Omnitrophica bacterium]|nr:valine--tRNA ligase [Candidatus Omnitrophota bacterium]